MAKPACPKCGHYKFKMVEADEIENANYGYFFICCKFCGAVVGTHEAFNLTEQIQDLKKKISQLENKVKRVK